MKIIEPSVELINPPVYSVALDTIEAAGRTCYKSEDKMGEGTAEGFVRRIIERGHEAVLEHINITVRFICDRGVSHELVRHRMASYCQESTRYCNYSGERFDREITVIRPCFWSRDDDMYELWYAICRLAERQYLYMIDCGATPQEARSVLPNSLKTEVVMTANIREWRHFFRLRCAPAAHPQMRQVAEMLLRIMKETYPVFFADLEE